MNRNRPAAVGAVGAGAVIGALDGPVGLGGPEFRLPLLNRGVSVHAAGSGDSQQGDEPGRRRLRAAVPGAGGAVEWRDRTLAGHRETCWPVAPWAHGRALTGPCDRARRSSTG
jgi:hypothetical protein